ncbi:tetratricopeptide repeat protein [Thermodesulfobacteriota bacterium]
MQINKQSNFIIIITLVLFNLIIYFNGINNDFVWDDTYLIRDNLIIRDISNFNKLMSKEDKPDDFAGRGYFRPFINLTYLVDYKIFNNAPAGYRLTNIALHISTVIIMFFLLLLITENTLLSFSAALIFSAQAVHAEAVTLLHGRNNVICALFILLSLLFYVLSDKMKNKKYLIHSMIFLFLGAISKEFALMLPIIFILYDHTFDEQFTIKKHYKKYITSFAVIFLFFVYRTLAVPMEGAFRLNLPTLYLRLINMLRVHVSYMRSQIIPDNLSIYFDLPLAKSIFAPEIFVSLITISAIIFLVIYFRKKDKVPYFALFTYFLLLVPVSHIFEIPGNMMADRWLYPASFAFALFLASLIFHLFSKNIRYATVFIIIFSIFLSFFLLKRNKALKNDFTFYLDTVRVSPNSALARNNLGNELDKRGRFDKALEQYLMAIELNPDYNLPYNNIGVIYGRKKEHKKALKFFLKSYELNPLYSVTPFNIAVTYDDLGKIEEAIKHYKIAISLNPEDFNSYYSLAAAYYRLKDYKSALDILEDARKIAYDDARKSEIEKKIKMMKVRLDRQIAAESATTK